MRVTREPDVIRFEVWVRSRPEADKFVWRLLHEGAGPKPFGITITPGDHGFYIRWTRTVRGPE